MAIGDGNQFNWKSAIAVAKETTWGTFVTETAFFEFDSESMQRKIPGVLLPSINSQREVHKRILGNEAWGGSISAPLNVASDAIILLIKQAMGGTCSSVAVTTGSYIHTIQTGDMESNANTSTATDTKSLSITVRKGGNHVWRSSGNKVSKLTISGEVGKPVQVSFEIIGKTASLTTALSATVAYSDTIPLIWTGVVITSADHIGSITSGSAQTYKSFELSIDNKLDGGQYQLGSRQIGILPQGGLDVMLKLGQRFDTSTAHDAWLAETPTAFRIMLGSGQTIGATTGQTTYSMYIDIPRAMLDYELPTVGGRDGILEHTLNYQCLRENTTTSYAVQMNVYNATSSYP